MEENKGVIDRVFDTLEAVAYSQEPMQLKDIALKVNLNKTTVHRLLASLIKKGYIFKNLDGKYVLGNKYIQLASYYINSLELHSEANPYLSVLYSQLNLTVVLGVLENNKLVYVNKIDLYPTQKSFLKVGYIAPIYCSSIGKILLSSLSGKALDNLLSHTELKKYTDNTITDIEKLKKHLKSARIEGFAMDDEESAMDHRCVAVPIYDYTGEVIAGVGVSGTMDQLPNKKLSQIINQLKETAIQISMRMGYTF